MKLIAILLTAAFLNAHAAGNAQRVTLPGKSLGFKEVFAAIEQQTGYVVFGNKELFAVKKRISLPVQDMPLRKLLDTLLYDQPFDYTLEDKTIFISRKAEVAQTLAFAAALPPPPVTIRVTDSTGSPLEGASVHVKHSKKSGMTDGEGKLTLVLTEGDELVISFIGMERKVVKVTKAAAAQQLLGVVLQASAAHLEELSITVVNTGYQRIKPEQSTGAVSRITTKAYESRISTNFLAGLANRLPGVLINNDIQFEDNNLFQIRGLSTITGNRNPLIVVDGYPTDLTLDMLDPNEIKSVTILKDAAAATVYGVRASNGVVVIERKQASVGNTRYTFRATTSLTPRERYERYRWEKNSATAVNYVREGRQSSVDPTTWPSLEMSGFWELLLPTESPVYIAMLQQAAGVITDAEANEKYSQWTVYNNARDYGKLFLRNAFTQSYNFNLSGGTAKALYYVTANYTRNALTQKNNDNNRLMFSARSNFNFSRRFSLELTTDYQQARSHAAPVVDINALFPFERLQDSDGNPLPAAGLSRTVPYFNDRFMQLGVKDNMYYPLQEMNEVSDRDRTVINRFTANFKYVLGRGVDLTFGGIYESTQQQVKHLAGEQSAEVRQAMNRYATPDLNGNPVFNIPAGDFLRERMQRTTGLTGRAQLNYNSSIGKDHQINAILGAEIRRFTEEGNEAAYFGYNDRTLINQPVNYLLLNNTNFPTWGLANDELNPNTLFAQRYNDNRFLSGYTNLVYSYKSKYSLTGSVRVDQSNLFGTNPQYRYKPLWSVGAAWNLHKEDFLKNVEWINNLKLRAATGFNGNVARNVLPQTIAEPRLNNYFTPSILSLVLLSNANSRLRWEQTRNHNIGVDFGLFGRVNGSLDYYNKLSTDLLASSRIDATRGAASAWINQGSIRNTGIELNLNADWITRSKFNWNTGLVLSRNAGKILDVYNPLTSASVSLSYITARNVAYMKDYPVGAMFAFRYAGLNNQGLPLIYDSEGKAKRYGTEQAGIRDVDFVGTSIPTINAGISNRVDVGDFYVFCMINYYGGFKVKVPPPSPSDRRPLEGAGNYWKQTGDELVEGKLPSLAADPTDRMILSNSNAYVVNGAYMTLGDVTVSYNLRRINFIRKAGFTNFEIKLQASNLYTVGFNRFNYSVAAGPYVKGYVTPTYSLALFTNF